MKKLCVKELLSGRQVERSKSIRRDEIECSVKRVMESAGVATAVDLGAELMKLACHLQNGYDHQVRTCHYRN